MAERKRVRIVPYGERKPLYAAYRAAHEEADRIGGTLSDDLIVQAAVKAYEKALTESGRLLPPGGEVRDQFTVLEIDPKQRNGGMVIHWSLERAEEGKTRFKNDSGGYEGWPYRPGPFGIYRRQMRTWGDGSEHYTPWSPVVSDTSEKAATQWMIRDADGLESDYASDEREIRQSWAQGITWWDPEGSYELCRREGPDAPWEVVERHPVVSDKSEVPNGD